MIYYAFSDYLKQRYGEKVYKLPIGLPLTCPNRDGSCGKFGCTFAVASVQVMKIYHQNYP